MVPACYAVGVRLAAAHARAAAEEATALAASAQAAANERAAELRVAQDTLRSMREECNEHWVRDSLVVVGGSLSSLTLAACIGRPSVPGRIC